MENSRGLHSDVVYYNGTIVTMDEANPSPEAVATLGDRIVALGSAAALKATAGPRTRLVDLAGKTMVPGLIEPHTHPHMYPLWAIVANLRCPPMGPVSCMADLVESLKEWAKGVPEGEWIKGFGYDEFGLSEGRHPTRHDLDKVSTDRPIIVFHYCGHHCILNSKALELTGVTRDTPQPAGGAIGKDRATGEPTGMFSEIPAMMRAAMAMPKPSEAQGLEYLSVAARDYLRTGVTSTYDAGIFWKEDLVLYQRAIAEGVWPFRTTLMMPLEALPGGSYKNFPFLTGFGGTHLKIGPMKLFVDGSVVGYTGWLREPYTQWKGDHGDSHGMLVNSPERLKGLVMEAHRAGFQVAIHAGGDAAIDIAVQAIRDAQGTLPRPDARHRIEHAHMAQEDQLDAMAELGITPSFYPSHIYYWGDRYKSTILGPERAERLHPLKSAADRGIRFSLHSDCPMSWVSPLFCMWAGVNRATFGGEVLGPGFRITPHQALKAVTIDAAWQNFEESLKGSIEVGKLADFTVLGENPLQVDPMRIKDIKVEEVILGGERRYKTG